MRIAFLGGLNEQQQPNLNEAAAGSQNFDLNKSTLQFIPRAPVDSCGVAPNGSTIYGIMQLVKRDNSETTLIQAGKDIYTWDGAATWAVKGSCNASSTLRDCYWSLDDWLIITDTQKLTPVSRWTGSVFGTLPTGLSTTYAKFAAVHLNRAVLANVKIGSTDSPHVILFSAFENSTSFNSTKRAGDATFTTGDEAFFLVSPDLKPINGLCEFYGTLLISTVDGALYKLTGTDSTNMSFDPFYPRSNAAGDDSMVNVGNDVMYMKQGGAIESLSATQQYGDVRADDLSRWIPDSTNGLTSAIAVYDQKNQKVLFFVSAKILVLFKDFLGSQLSPWSVYKTDLADSFNTFAAKYMKYPGTQTYTVLFGGSSGQIYDLNGDGTSGDGGDYDITSVRNVRPIDEADQVNLWKHQIQGRVQYRRVGPVTLSISFEWGDELNTSTCDILLKPYTVTSSMPVFGGTYYFGDSIYFNFGDDSTRSLATKGFSPTGRGPAVSIGLTAQTTTRFQIDHIDLK